MEKLTDDHPGPHECWEELAEHSLTHDDLILPVAAGAAAAPSAAPA